MKKIITGVSLAFVPSLALAQTTGFSILAVIKNIMDILIPMLITLALIYFIIGVIKYIISKDADAKGEARNTVVRGIIGLFIIVSIWGIVGIIQDTFQIPDGNPIEIQPLPDVIPDSVPDLNN